MADVPWEIDDTKASVPWEVDDTVKANVEKPAKLTKTQAKLRGNNPLGWAIGAGEEALHMGSGMVAKPLSDVAALAGIVGDATGIWKNDPAKTQAKVNAGLTYSPSTDMGKIAEAYNPITAIGENVISPATQFGGDVAQMVTGDTSGAVKGGVTEALQQRLGFMGVKGLRKKPATTHTANIVKNNALDKGTSVGLKASPLELNAGVISKQLNEIADPSAVSHANAVVNQPKTNALVREQLGLPKEAPLTNVTYDVAKAKHYAPYSEASQMGQINLAGKVPKQVQATGGVMDAGAAVEQVKQLRRDSNAIAKSPNYDPKTAKQGRKMKEAADYLEAQIDAHAMSIGKTDLPQQLKDARKAIAQVETFRKATKGGDISASKLSKALEKGVPLEGNALTIAEFYDQAPASMRRPNMGASAFATPGLMSSGKRIVAKELARVASTYRGGKSMLRKPASAAAIVEALRNREQEDATQ